MAEEGRDMPVGKKGIDRVYHATLNSLNGLRFALRDEAAFRQELFLLVFFTPFAILMPVDLPRKILLIGSLFVVLIVELLNSAVEAIVDKVCPDFDLYAKKSKDMGSAAVLLSLVLAFLTWTAILVEWCL